MFNKFSRQSKCKLNNSGSTMMIVVVAIALISVLATVLMSMSYMNYNMKVTEYNSKKNFYSAEVVLDQINVGLQKEMSDSLEDAYVRSMQRYTLDDDETRNANFANYYISELTKRLRTAALDTKYQIDPIDTDADGIDDCGLVHYLDSALQAAYASGNLVISSDEAKMQSVAVSRINSEGNIEYESKGLVLYDVNISYTDSNDFTTVIKTDIRLQTPALKLVTKTAMPNVLDYCLVADSGIQGSVAGVTTKIAGNVYAGNDTNSQTDLGGIICSTAHNWTFEGDTRVVSAGPLQVEHGATLVATADTNCWVNNIILPKHTTYSGTLKLLGQTYVKDDLTIEGKGAQVTLAGEYNGFGYGATAEESSAIIINGKNSVLDMTGLERLMLGGNAYIQTSKVTYNVDEEAGYTEGLNTDILTGNALAVKSDQIAYLVPAECVGVNGSELLIGKNPMSADEYKQWLKYENERVNGNEEYKEYKLVSLTKGVSILGKSLGEYETNGSGYKTVFRTINGDTLCYLYLDLTKNGATKYYKEYYYAAESKMNRYITTYNNRILMDVSTMKERSTRGTILSYALDTTEKVGDISLIENTVSAATTAEEILKLENDYKVNADRYERLKAKLTIESSDVTTDELAHTVYENLINEAEIDALPNDNIGKTYEYQFASTGITSKAVFVNNRGKAPYYCADDDVCVIVATGDVYLQTNFDGLLITDGKIVFDSGVANIVPNKALVLKTLRQMESEVIEADTKSLIARYFKNGEMYSLDTKLSGEVTNSLSGQSMGELIVYENWTKQ